ncbi:MAG TPA: SDR family oxidoreductase [Kofleriaceae bacterium]|nr:SDR family oxidoreductase [Kofleriaceae bacterium]
MGTTLIVRNILRNRRMIDVAGNVVVITGGSRGLGLVLARTLVERGARVAICARDTDELARARRELEQLGGEVFSAPCDVTDRDDVLRFMASVEDDFGPIDVLINNAGLIQVGPLEHMTADDFEQALAVNLRGPLHATLAVLPAMRRRKAGRIVNIASLGGRVAVPHLAPYSTSKFALVGMSEAMRAELVKDNIFVTTVCPGLMRTGSPRHGLFKGNHQAEYAWFTIGDSLSITSISAESAAEQIIRGLSRGDAAVTISPQAKLLSFVHGVAPGLVQEVLGAINRFMPGPTSSRTTVEGKDAESVFAPSVLTRASDDAARRNNEN